jgi:putative protease
VNYFRKVEAAAVRLTGDLSVGDVVTIAGETTDITQRVDSMQIENDPVESAGPSEVVGIRVKSRVRPGDVVYREQGD